MSSELIDSFAYITPTPGHLFIDILHKGEE